MADQEKIVGQRTDELTAMRRRVGELEAAVAECRQGESELRSEVERLRILERIVEDSPDGFSVVDRNYVYRTVNHVYLELHGRTADQIVGHSVADLLGENAFQNIVRPNLDRCFAGETVRYESWFTYAEGGRRYVEVRYYPLRKDAQVEYAVVVSHDITERKQAELARTRLAKEQAARAEAEVARQQINNILESITDAFFALDRQWRFSYLNREAERLLRKKREELLGENVWEEFPEAVSLAFYPEYHKAMSEQLPIVFEVFYPPYDMWVEVHAYPSEEALSVYFHDITERKRAEDALRESEAKYRSLYNAVEAGIVVHDPDGRIVDANKKAQQILGLTREQMAGLTSMDPRWQAVHEDGSPFSGETHPAQVALRTGERVDGVIMGVVQSNGERRWLLVNAQPIVDRGTGATTGAVATFMDVTERKRAEQERDRLLEEVRRRAAELDATITAIPDGLLIFDEAGEAIRINPAAEKAMRFTPEELKLPFAERLALMHLETAEGKPFRKDQLAHERALRGETVRGIIVATHPPYVAKTLWQTTSAAPVRAPDGRPLGAVLVFTDVTALHELQEWLQDLIRTVSHDLRNPLLVIQGQAQLLLRLLDRAGLKGPEVRSAQAIITGAKRMNAMIQDLVESARLESGQLRLEKRPVALKAFVTDLLDRMKGVMDVGRIKVEMPTELQQVSTDPDRLERIFVNLVGNALKYSPPETEVLIRAERTHAEVTVSITDRGMGIAPEDLAHIFERFYRTRGARKAEGLGLGLYITKALVEAHGGGESGSKVWWERAALST